MLPRYGYQPPEDGLPPKEVHIVNLRAVVWPEDHHRVRVHLEITPFLERPNMEIQIADESGYEVASINIIESIDTQMAFTMHIRGEESTEPFTLKASVLYPEIGVVNEKSVLFVLSEKDDQNGNS